MSVLLDLAARVEALSGPDRAVDEDIHEALGWAPVENPTKAMGLLNRWRRPDETLTGHEGPPCVTASLDAAMMLVPEGCAPVIDWSAYKGQPGIYWEAFVQRIEDGKAVGTAEASTPALALTAAALRAKAGQP